MKTVIFGGSFNPIHLSHIYIIKQLENLFDRVIVVPNYISPFKLNEYTDSRHRLNMIQCAFKEESIKKAEICEYETKREQTSYTIDTIKHLNIKNPYLVIGSENLKTLNNWKNIEELKRIVAFYVVNRLGFIENSEFITAPFAPPDISSALIKVAIAFNKADSMLNKSVLNYIKQNNLYTNYNHIVERFKDYNLSKNRIEHTYFATKYAINLAKIHGESVDKAIISTLLHDIAKELDDENLRDIPKKVRHGIIGAKIAKESFTIDDEDILNAIKFHTSARENMSNLEKIVFLADSLEETRVYEGVNELRKTAETDLNKAMEQVLSALIEKLIKENKDIYYLSKQALNYYKEINNGTSK